MSGEIITERLIIADALESDINMIIGIEKAPDNHDFICDGTYEEHLSEINDDKHLLLLFRRKFDGIPVGFSLSCIDFESDIFELRRIVIIDKGKGFGREAMNGHFRYAFEQAGMNRFWLDVYPNNEIGIKLYDSLNMHRDGILRQSYKTDKGYLDQIIYSMLKREYFEMRGKNEENPYRIYPISFQDS